MYVSWSYNMPELKFRRKIRVRCAPGTADSAQRKAGSPRCTGSFGRSRSGTKDRGAEFPVDRGTVTAGGWPFGRRSARGSTALRSHTRRAGTAPRIRGEEGVGHVFLGQSNWVFPRPLPSFHRGQLFSVWELYSRHVSRRL